MLRHRRNGGLNVEGENHIENMPLNIEFAEDEQIPERNANAIGRRMDEVQNVALGRAQARAEEIADDPRRVDQVIVNARARQDQLRAAAGGYLVDDFVDMIDMLQYADIYPLLDGTKLLILGSLIYVASPVDLIADIIPVVGFLDDMSILTLTAAQIKLEIADFRRWRENNPLAQIRRERQPRQERGDFCPNCVIA